MALNMSPGHASSVLLVSCSSSTSGALSASHGSRRGSRDFTELTFQVAMRTPPPCQEGEEQRAQGGSPT